MNSASRGPISALCRNRPDPTAEPQVTHRDGHCHNHEGNQGQAEQPDSDAQVEEKFDETLEQPQDIGEESSLVALIVGPRAFEGLQFRFQLPQQAAAVRLRQEAVPEAVEREGSEALIVDLVVACGEGELLA